MRTRNDCCCHSVPWTQEFLRLNFFSRKAGTTHFFRVQDTVKNVVRVCLSIQPKGLGLNKDFRLKWGSLKCHCRDASGWEDSRTFESSFWLVIGQEENSRQKRAILVSPVRSHLNETHGVFMSYISSYTSCYRLLSDQGSWLCSVAEPSRAGKGFNPWAKGLSVPWNTQRTGLEFISKRAICPVTAWT